MWGKGGGGGGRRAQTRCILGAVQVANKRVPKDNHNSERLDYKSLEPLSHASKHRRTGRGGEGGAAPPKFGQLRFFGQQQKIWAKPVFKDVSMFVIIIIIILKR